MNNLTVNIKDICYEEGRLKEGLVYLKDYVLFSPRFFKLFSKWYKFTEMDEIERERIIISDNEEIIKKNDLINNEVCTSMPTEGFINECVHENQYFKNMKLKYFRYI